MPLPRLTTVGGIPLTELLPKDRIDAIVDRTKNGVEQIYELKLNEVEMKMLHDSAERVKQNIAKLKL